MVAVMSSHGSRRQIRQCKRYVFDAVVLASADVNVRTVGRGSATSSDSSDDEDDNRSGVRPDDGDPALVATNTARFSRM